MHLLITSVAVAVVFAVAEVLLRYATSAATIQPGPVALAVYANAALLGVIAVGCALFTYVVVNVILRIGKKGRSAPSACPRSLCLGVVAGTLTLATDFGGLAPESWSRAALIASGVAVAVWLCGAWSAGRVCFGISSALRVCVCLVWLVSLALTGAAVARTKTRVEAWIGATSDSQSPSLIGSPNIILVIVDTLRADRVGDRVGGSLTPHLDRLCESSAVFSNALSTAPWTLPAHASLFTGLFPDGHGVNWGRYKLDTKWPTLGELLKSKGYATLAISNNWLVSEANGFDRGFDAFMETSRDPSLSPWQLALQCGAAQHVKRWIGLSADAGWDAGSAWTNWLFRQRLRHRQADSRPFFAFVNYFEPHDPYHPPDRYLHRFLSLEERREYRSVSQREDLLAAQACGVPDVYTEDQIGLLSRLYDAEVAYQDEAIGDLLDILQGHGLLDNSWLVITSDHGELFGEWNMVYHTASSHFQLLHVPLIVRPPGGTTGRRMDHLAQPVDVFATLLAQAGVPMPNGVTDAHVLPTKEGEAGARMLCVAESHGASIAGLSNSQRMFLQADLTRWLSWVTTVYADGYLLQSNSRGPEALYHVHEDPKMERNIAEERPEVVRSLRLRLRERDARVRNGDAV